MQKVMDINMCKELIKEMPFPCALALLTAGSECKLTESNSAFDIMFGINEEKTSCRKATRP
jgi:hypothetical protein